MSKLKVGDKLPDITLQNQNGEPISLRNGNHAKVIYFYPKDETPGCTAEACSFRDQFEVFEDHGAKVYGISRDSVTSHKKFAKRHRLNFNLLSDKEKKAERAFGVPTNFLGLLPGRVTFVFDKSGSLVHSFSSQLMATKHIKEAIDALKMVSTD